MTPEVLRSFRHEGDVIPKPRDASDGPLDGPGLVALVEVVGAEVFIRGSIAEQMMSDNQNSVGHCHRCALGPAAGSDPVVLGGEVGPPGHATGRD